MQQGAAGEEGGSNKCHLVMVGKYSQIIGKQQVHCHNSRGIEESKPLLHAMHVGESTNKYTECPAMRDDEYPEVWEKQHLD